MLKKVLMTAAFTSMAFGQSLEDRVEALEYAGYENWFKFGGALEYRFDSVERKINKAYNQTTFGGDTVQYAAGREDNVKHHTLFAEIDIEAKPSEKLTFYGRLATAKSFNNFNGGGADYAAEAAFGELGQGQSLGSSSVWLERAFVNYNLTKDLALSVGRLPTIEGAPKHMPQGRSMMGSYPLLAFAGIYDGLALTYTKSFGGNVFKLRGIYTPFNQRNFGLTNQKLTDTNGFEVDESVDVFSFMFEYERENLSWARRIHFIYQYLGFNGLHTDSNNQTTTTFNTTANAIIANTTYGNTNLELSRHVLNLEAYGLFNTGLNFGLTFLKGNMKSTGDSGVNTRAANGTSLGSTSFGTWYGAAGSNDLDGDAWIANLNYTIKALRSATVGIEYMDSDPDAFLYDSAARNRIGFYTARGGSSIHYYWSQPIDQNFRFQVGYQKVENKKTNALGGYFGTASEIDNELTAVYSNLQFFF